MTVINSKPGEVIDVQPLFGSVTDPKTNTLLETEHVKVIHMVLSSGKELADHKAPGDIIVQCIEGAIAFAAKGKTQQLKPGGMLYLHDGDVHSVKANEDSSFLLTIVRTS